MQVGATATVRDCGQRELAQKFADRTGLQIEVKHFPTGTSKWNKIEHKLFSFITRQTGEGIH